MIEDINMFKKITCDKCGHAQTELLGEFNEKAYQAGWSMNHNAKKYIHVCGLCNGKKAPIKVMRNILMMQNTNPYPLIKNIES